MKWKRGPGRGQIEDRRGQSGFGGFGTGGGGFPLPIPRGGAGLGLGGVVLVGVILLVLFLTGAFSGGGFDIPGQNLPAMPEGQGLTGAGQDAELADFVAFVVDDVQRAWQQDFSSAGRTYQVTKLVLFDGRTQSGCGPASSETGPFYCPVDRKVYVDLSFYDELKRRFRAPGDFAQAYVIAHEVGHHVQTLLGIADKVQELKQSYPRDANAIQVRMELQADCFAGVWANLNNQLHNRLEQGDIEEALNAASRIGDDMIQRQTQGHVVPESFTHGSSEQRVRWFKTGYQSGNMQACDTFRARDL
jgi:predicted metalloprotease